MVGRTRVEEDTLGDTMLLFVVSIDLETNIKAIDFTMRLNKCLICLVCLLAVLGDNANME